MRTSEFPYYDLPFEEFNPAQEAVVPYLTDDVNLVVAFETAAGKSALAECAFAYHLSVDPECKVVYVSPFRSLSSEKFEEWGRSSVFGQHLLLSSSESVPDLEEYESARFIVITTESFDSKTRSDAHLLWLKKVSCIVFDEAHLLGDKSRGSSLESAMMRIANISPHARIFLLSGTLDNSVEVAKWVKSLNGKVTRHVRSLWRPCELVYNLHSFEDVYSKYDNMVKEVGSLIGRNLGEKVLVFVHSKKVGEMVVKELRGKGIRAGFHNAALSPKKRKELENTFSSDLGLDVLVSTSTLSSGVNL